MRRDFCQIAAATLLGAVLLGAGAPAADAVARFGRNKVQYDRFDWRVLVTDHLEIHFYPEEEALARRAARYGEEACVRLEEELGHQLVRRIPVVLYESPQHFRQNNVTPTLVGESTGGLTEIFRNRVVLPYGSSEREFRHVITHELVHATMFDCLYGDGWRSHFILQYAFYIPLWFAEGLAEYYSTEWDSESEMMIRDAAVAGTLPPFDQIYGGYFVYKSGFSAIGYLVERYGADTPRRILVELRTTRDLRAAVQNVTGESIEEIAGDWLTDVRRRAWPSFAELSGPEDLGIPLTNRSMRGAVNIDPTLSPSGRRVAFISDRSGTPDLYVLEIEEAKEARPLVRGSRGGDFESLHPARSSVGWSPDERLIVVVAESQARDVLYVIDVEKGRVVAEFAPPLDALERPDWSPADASFLFTGLKDGQVDLYTLAPDGTGLTRLTNDAHSERGARWSPDGRWVLFTADRDDSTGCDLWVLDPRTREARPLVVAAGDQWGGTWHGDGSAICYVSDECGTRDLMMAPIVTAGFPHVTGEPRRLTALVGGADSPTAAQNGTRLVFSVYDKHGWDLVLVEDPDTLSAAAAPVAVPEKPWRGLIERVEGAHADSTGDAPTAAPEGLPPLAGRAAADLPDTAAAAEPRITDYHPRFRTEWITGGFAYNGWGASGGIQSSISDVLGNHRFHVGAQIFRSLKDSDGYVSYTYLPRRFDYGLSVFHVKDYLYDSRTTLGQPIGEEDDREFFSERRWGAAASVSYPFHTFRRVGLEVAFFDLERTRYTDESREFGADLEETGRFSSRMLLPEIHHTFDNTLWGRSGPVQGTRSVVLVRHAIPLGRDRLVYGTALGDWRHYWRFADGYSLALRGMAAVSFGEDPEEFQLGGPNTIRGHRWREINGRHAAVASLEFRYPFIEYIQLGWPFRASFGGVRGNLFLDVGTAFDDAAGFRLTEPRDEGGANALSDLLIGFGAGMRFHFAYLPLRVDVGWPTDLARVGAPRWHVTIGPEY
jgi:Tol biopolymer transport system component